MNAKKSLMRDRILHFLQSEQLSSTQFADKIGVQRSSVSHILSGRNNPSYDFLRKILENFSTLNPEWLMLGTGEMYRTGKDTELFKNTGEEHGGEDNVPLEGKVVEKRKPGENMENEMKAGTIRSSEIERVVIFYRDSTFSEYHPSG
ncbi:MAG: helix-turn-helix transcriptional regulator [Bacteroidales bacterium]|nr:MAG: helix-turn-helix transcriptional regulator [Bacteroidales bacterium]